MSKAEKTPAVSRVCNPEIVTMLDAASVHAASADRMARDAAVKAHGTECLDIVDCAERVATIGALYRPNLANQTVKLSFMAALSILVADKPVRFAADAKIDNPAKGTTSFDKPEALTPVAPKEGDEVPEGKTVFEMSAEDAIARLPANLLKMASPMANAAIGKAREARHVVKKATARAPFFDEMAAVIRDKGLEGQFFEILGIAAQGNRDIQDRLIGIMTKQGYKVAKLSKAEREASKAAAMAAPAPV